MKELIDTVKQMRYWQKEYFKTRAFPALDNARKFERKVDQLLDEQDNPTLFSKP